jgi:hypothetical protein
MNRLQGDLKMKIDAHDLQPATVVTRKLHQTVHNSSGACELGGRVRIARK